MRRYFLYIFSNFFYKLQITVNCAYYKLQGALRMRFRKKTPFDRHNEGNLDWWSVEISGVSETGKSAVGSTDASALVRRVYTWRNKSVQWVDNVCFSSHCLRRSLSTYRGLFVNRLSAERWVFVQEFVLNWPVSVKRKWLRGEDGSRSTQISLFLVSQMIFSGLVGWESVFRNTLDSHRRSFTAQVQLEGFNNTYL